MEVLNKAKQLHQETAQPFLDVLNIPGLASLCADYLLETPEMLFEHFLLRHIWRVRPLIYEQIWNELVEMAKSNRMVAEYLSEVYRLVTVGTTELDRFGEAVSEGRPDLCHRLACFYINENECSCGSPVLPRK